MGTAGHSTSDLFQSSPVLRWIGLVVSILVFQMATGTTWIMMLPWPCFSIIGLSVLLTLVGEGALAVVRAAFRRYDLALSPIQLWAFPLGILGSNYLVLFGLLVVLPSWLGRAFWTRALDINAKGATILFTSIIFGLLLYMGFFTAAGVFRHLRAVLAGSFDPEVFREQAERLEADRNRARKVNRVVFWGVLAGLTLACGWIIYVRPETILFYRGHIQLQSRQYDEVALETFSHLARKYPEYRYLDAVEYRMAWILERRLRKFPEAARAYEEFLRKWRYDNIWADDALASLARITLDKLGNPAAALRWTELYREQFPDGHLLPHIELYRARALRALHRETEAEGVLAEAQERFRARLLPIYDSEDDLAERIPFEAAAKLSSGFAERP